MKDFDHPNILGLVGVSFHDSPQLPLIVLPFMANGDLKTFLHSKRDFEHEPNVTHFPKVRIHTGYRNNYYLLYVRHCVCSLVLYVV